MIASFVVTLLAAHSLALPGLNSVGLEPGADTLYGELLSQELSKRGVVVMTGRDVAAVLGLERQKQLMGCAETSGCVAELAAALGVEGVVVGDVGKLGSEILVNLKVLSASTGTVLAQYSNRGHRLEEISSMLAQGASSLVSQLSLQWSDLQPGKNPSERSTPPRMSRWWAMLPALLGGAALSLGVVFQIQAERQLQLLRGASNLTSAQLAFTRGRSAETVGNVLLGASIAGGIVAVLILFWNATPTVTNGSALVAEADALGAFNQRIP
jgi:TolB-like protein